MGVLGWWPSRIQNVAYNPGSGKRTPPVGYVLYPSGPIPQGFAEELSQE